MAPIDRWRALRHSAAAQHRVHVAGWFAHLSYLAAVVVEAHGAYAIAAGVLAVFVTAERVFGEG